MEIWPLYFFGLIEMTEKDIQPCMIFIDKEGKWFHKGAEMIHREIIQEFYRNMEIDSQGRYIINWRGDQCYLEVEDVPFIIRRAELKGPVKGTDSKVSLYLSDDEREDLMPDTLHAGNDHVLYCSVKKGRFPARFSRAAYYQLGEYIEEDKGRYFLPLNGERYYI
jgi:hypothetical protein